jgi:ribosomal protein L37AE/L43A
MTSGEQKLLRLLDELATAYGLELVHTRLPEYYNLNFERPGSFECILSRTWNPYRETPGNAYMRIREQLEGEIAPAGPFTCPRCQRTSHHPVDQEVGWCSACEAYTRDAPEVTEKIAARIEARGDVSLARTVRHRLETTRAAR